MGKKDTRIKLVSEVLNGIKVIKLYAWEIPFKELIMGIRKSELQILRKYSMLNASFSFIWTSAPFMVSAGSAHKLSLQLYPFLLLP